MVIMHKCVFCDGKMLEFINSPTRQNLHYLYLCPQVTCYSDYSISNSIPMGKVYCNEVEVGKKKHPFKGSKCKACGASMLRYINTGGSYMWICPNIRLQTEVDKSVHPPILKVYCREA